MLERIFFDNVVAKMKELNLSSNALSRFSGVSIYAISGITNQVGNPSLDTMEKIAIALGVRVVELLTPKNPEDYPDLDQSTTPKSEKIPDGYEHFSATLPKQKAFVIRKWDVEAHRMIQKIKRIK